MKVVFLVPGSEGRPRPINGETIRYGNAPSSGTEQSVILVAEYLASTGNDVTVVIHKTDYATVNNVKYTDFSYSNIDQEVDILVTMLWFDKYVEIPFKVTKKVIHWFHMAWGYGIQEIKTYCIDNNLPLILVNPSAFSQHHNSHSYNLYLDSLIECSRVIIPNPLDSDLVEEVKKLDIQRDPNKVIFHAQFSRGGSIVKEVLSKFDDKYYLKHFDYVEPERGIGKLELFKELAEATYFIFPLYHPNGCVYKDTFSCAVAEAIAMGVKVITYPLGAFPEYFSSMVFYANFPDNVSIDRLYTERVSCEIPEFYNIQPFVDALKLAESNPDKFIPHFEFEAKNFINRFSIKQIGKLWSTLLN